MKYRNTNFPASALIPDTIFLLMAIGLHIKLCFIFNISKLTISHASYQKNTH